MIPLIVKEIQERKAVLVIGLLLCLLPRLLTIIFSLSGEWQGLALRELGWVVSLTVISILAVFFTMFLAGPALSGELEKETLPFLISLPVSRGIIWLSKLIASFLCLCLILGFFLLVNSELILWKELGQSLDDPLTIILIFLPLLMLAITFYSSSVTRREMTSNGLALLLLVATLAAIALLSYALIWITSAYTIIYILILLILIFLMMSLFIFSGPDLLNERRVRSRILIGTLSGILILAAAIPAFYFLDETASLKRPSHFARLQAEQNTILIKAIYGDENDGSFGSRLWIYNNGSLARLPSSRVIADAWTPQGEIDYISVKHQQILGKIISDRISVDYWRTDPAGRNRRLLYSFPAVYSQMWYIEALPVDPNMALIIPKRDEKGDSSSIRIIIFSPEGKILRELSPPPLAGRGYYRRVYGAGGRIYHSVGDLLWQQNYSPSQGKKQTLAMEEINPADGSNRIVYDIPAVSVEGKYIIHTIPRFFSPDGKHQLFLKSWYLPAKPGGIVDEGTNAVKIQLVKRELENGTETVVYESKDSEIYVLKAYPESGELIIGLSSQDDDQIRRVILCGLDGRQDEIPLPPAREGVARRDFIWSEDGKKMASSFYDRASNQRTLMVEDIHNHDIKSFTVPAVITEPRFSPDGGRIVFMSWPSAKSLESKDAQGPPDSAGDGFPVILDCASGAMTEIRELTFDRKRDYRYYYSQHLIFLDNDTLIITRDRGEIRSMSLSSRKTKRIYP